MSEQTDSTDDLIFRDPPPSRRGAASPITLWLRRLRDHPGRWAAFPDLVNRSMANNVKIGTYAGTTKGEFDATARTEVAGDPKGFRLYARYIGPAEDAES